VLNVVDSGILTSTTQTEAIAVSHSERFRYCEVCEYDRRREMRCSVVKLQRAMSVGNYDFREFDSKSAVVHCLSRLLVSMRISKKTKTVDRFR